MHPVALGLLAVLVLAGPAAAEPLTLSGKPLDAGTGTRVGALTYLGGLALNAPDPNVGGLSGLAVRDGGERLLAVSDTGIWLRARLDLASDGRPAGIRDARMGRLRDTHGHPLMAKADTDAESLARDGNGGVLVAFERRHRLRRIPQARALDAAARPVPVPDVLADVPANAGVEAMARLADGRLLLVTEGSRGHGDVPAWVRGAGGAWTRLAYRTRHGFRPTGAAALPDGGVLVLERKVVGLMGLRARLRRIPGAAIRAGATLMGTRLATLRPPLPLDNMEAVAAVPAPDGGQRIYLLSDDNHLPVQRTLLLAFHLPADAVGERLSRR